MKNHGLLAEGQGTCQRRENRPGVPGNPPSVWEGRREREDQASIERRHRAARILCRRCPALAECEERLAEYEREGKSVDGVVAGRYSDVRIWSVKEYQSHCNGCGRALVPQHSTLSARRAGGAKHMGEGLCKKCYSKLRRKNRGN